MRHSLRQLLPGRPSGRLPGPSHGRHPLPAAGAGRWRLVVLPILVAGILAGCSSLTPIEQLVIAQDAEPLLAQIRAGSVDVNQPLPWGGGFGIRPSYFTPLCAAAFVGATSAFAELLTLGADADASCGESSTPLDLVMRHPSGSKAAAMRALLQARGVDFTQPRYVQARM
jgi:hypothetical protein